jgi:hypothetical protein
MSVSAGCGIYPEVMKLLVQQLLLLLLPLAAVPHRAAAAAQLGEGCQLADSEKVDCGQMGTDQAGCEAMGCCWQPVDAASTYNNSSRTGKYPEPEFLNFKGAQESIPRNQFRQSM